MYLVTQGKYRINQLGYNAKTHEYVCLHKGVEQWRQPSINEDLFNYFNQVRADGKFSDDKEMKLLKEWPIYERYSATCQSYEYGGVNYGRD